VEIVASRSLEVGMMRVRIYTWICNVEFKLLGRTTLLSISRRTKPVLLVSSYNTKTGTQMRKMGNPPRGARRGMPQKWMRMPRRRMRTMATLMSGCR
jgi:hypothetical protein